MEGVEFSPPTLGAPRGYKGAYPLVFLLDDILIISHNKIYLCKSCVKKYINMKYTFESFPQIRNLTKLT